MKWTKRLALVLVVGLVLGAAGLWLVARHGFSARAEPWAIEELIARNVRRLATPAGTRALKNPVPLNDDTLAEARHHFADHCAICHGNDGSGTTTIGRNLYPKAPDMRARATQELSDGEIYNIIKNGIRFTGMPAWGEAHEEDAETWGLVHFLRHLPKIGAEELAEMATMNPQSGPEPTYEDEEVRKFLMGEEGPSTPSGEAKAPAHRH